IRHCLGSFLRSVLALRQRRKEIITHGETSGSKCNLLAKEVVKGNSREAYRSILLSMTPYISSPRMTFGRFTDLAIRLILWPLATWLVRSPSRLLSMSTSLLLVTQRLWGRRERESLRLLPAC